MGDFQYISSRIITSLNFRDLMITDTDATGHQTTKIIGPLLVAKCHSFGIYMDFA